MILHQTLVAFTQILAARIGILSFFFLKSCRSLTRRKILYGLFTCPLFGTGSWFWCLEFAESHTKKVLNYVSTVPILVLLPEMARLQFEKIVTVLSSVGWQQSYSVSKHVSVLRQSPDTIFQSLGLISVSTPRSLGKWASLGHISNPSVKTHNNFKFLTEKINK